MANTFNLYWTDLPAFEAMPPQSIRSAAGEFTRLVFRARLLDSVQTGRPLAFVLYLDGTEVATLSFDNDRFVDRAASDRFAIEVTAEESGGIEINHYKWQVWDLTEGSEKVISYGSWDIDPNLITLPLGPVVSPQQLSLMRGGTGTDLSETGPGILVQATEGADVSLIPLTPGGQRLLNESGDWINADGTGDMLKAVYDQNDNGIVDNSENLNSQPGSHYLNRTNHTGAQSISTVTNLQAELDSKVPLSILSYTHNQMVASDTWTINHNLGRKPNVSVVDSADTVIVGNITYIDDNTLTVTFSAAFSGKAYLG